MDGYLFSPSCFFPLSSFSPSPSSQRPQQLEASAACSCYGPSCRCYHVVIFSSAARCIDRESTTAPWQYYCCCCCCCCLCWYTGERSNRTTTVKPKGHWIWVTRRSPNRNKKWRVRIVETTNVNQAEDDWDYDEMSLPWKQGKRGLKMLENCATRLGPVRPVPLRWFRMLAIVSCRCVDIEQCPVRHIYHILTYLAAVVILFTSRKTYRSLRLSAGSPSPAWTTWNSPRQLSIANHGTDSTMNGVQNHIVSLARHCQLLVIIWIEVCGCKFACVYAVCSRHSGSKEGSRNSRRV